MANVTQLFQTVAAELEWAFLVRFSKASREQDLYALWARKRRELFRKWGNLPTIGNENRRIESLKNKYKGERIFIIGNGPSLNDTPLEKLEGEYTFGVNRIYLLFNRISWRPSFYTINDWEVGPDNAGEIEALEGMTFFFPKRFKGLFEQTDSTYWYNSRHARFKGDDFSYDLTDGAVMGGSVLPLAIQIAYYMGFDPIYLIGVDVNYKIPDTVKQSGTKRFADGNLQFLKSTKDDDCNHFDSSYFGKGRRWHNPNTERMIEGFRVCREAIEGQGGHIYNATVGGKLEVMERVDFNSIFEQEFNPPPKVSIVMPAHDAEPFIGEAINSVLAQTYQSWELIIVNDGSQDNTKQIIESFQDSRIICIDQENAGRPNARNTALKHVRGEYVTFLDADDFYESNNLELQVKFLQENKYAGAVVGSAKRVAENGRAIKTNIRPDGQPIPTKSFLIGNPAHLQSTMFRRQWVNPSVLFNPEARAGEDWEFNIQRALAGCTFVKQSAVICSYRCTERAKHKTTEPYAEAMVAVIDRIFDSMSSQPVYKEMEDLARYHVNLRMATRFFSTEQYELGQKYFLKALKYTDRFDDNFYESVSNNLVGWLIQLDTKKPSKVLKTAISYLPDTLDKKQVKRRSLSKLRKNFILRSGIGSSFFHNRQLRKSSEDEPTIRLDAYDREEHAHISETRLIFELTTALPSGSVMVDVGAHFGGSLERFAKNGWEVYAFEPDPVNRERLLSRIEDCKTVHVDSRAVSNCVKDKLPFFSSDVSFGISTLNPFHESHQETCEVSTTTVADICKDNELTSIDFLKIDTEGHDLMVLKGVPWEEIKPQIIECEFEDAKTASLGYRFEDIAQYLVDKGYTVLVSEWHPVVEYGKRHDWHRLVAYPCKLNDANAWGNLIAFREPPDFDKVAAIANRLVKTHPEKKYSKTVSAASDKNSRILQMISKARLKLTNPLNLYAVGLASSLLKRIAHYYSRWPVILAVIAIALNTASAFEVPFRWAFLMSGTGMLLFLVGHAASKADYALEAAEEVSRKANSIRQTANSTSQTADSALETANSASQTAASALGSANRISQTADSASQTADSALEKANHNSQTADSALETANSASQKLHKEHELWSNAIKAEKSARISSFARRDSSGIVPKRCLLQITIPRCGSTLLMDALRCHPGICLDPRAIIHEQLKLEGGRYPEALSEGSDASLDLEVMPHRGAKVPTFELPQYAETMGNLIREDEWFLEKIHPAFFQYDVEKFVENLKQYESENRAKVKFIYQVRDPKTALASYINYQKRDPSWNSDQGDPFAYMKISYKALLTAARKLEGLVVDYSDLQTDLAETLRSVYRFVWEGNENMAPSELIETAVELTARDKRFGSSNTTFLGKQAGDSYEYPRDLEPLFEEHSKEIEICYEYYQELLRMKVKSQL